MKTCHLTSCPVCGATRLKEDLTCVDHYTTGEVFRLCRCEACGFLFTQDFPDETEMGLYYESSDYISHSDTKRGMVNTVYHWARAYMLGRKARLVEREAHRNTGRLLDIGAGTGYFAHTMQQHGWQVTAVEKNEGARNFAREHFGLEVKSDAEEDKLPTDGFEVITLWHVMEHLQHLNETWDALRRMLTDDGVLIVAVPNRNSYDAGKYGAMWAAYDVPRHLWHFSPDNMQRIGVRHGFVLAGHYAMPLDAFYISMLSERYRGKKAAFWRGMWTGVKAWFSTWTTKERSSSMVYVFRKGRIGN